MSVVYAILGVFEVFGDSVFNRKRARECATYKFLLLGLWMIIIMAYFHL